MISTTSLRIGIGIGLLFAVVSIPFPFSFFPRWNYTNSDSILLYQVVLCLFIVGLITGVILSKFIKNVPFFMNLLYVSISFILAYYLLQYGFDKMFKSQFHFPEPNTLHTPLGHLSKDILFWSSMGSSYWYNLFMGSIEVLPALLLLNRKTRLLGAFISFGVLMNIWAINMSFDITVKVLSSVLLLLALFILSFSWRRLYSFFTEREVKKEKYKVQILSNSPILKRMIKGSIIGLFCLEIFLPYIQMGEINRDSSTFRKLYGSYTIIQSSENSLINKNIKRIHFHSKGYLILEDDQQQFEDHRITRSISTNKIQLIDKDLNIQLYENDGELNFEWELNGIINQVQMQKIDLQTLPLGKDDFHWFMESIQD